MHTIVWRWFLLLSTSVCSGCVPGFTGRTKTEWHDGRGSNSVCLCEACQRLDLASGSPMLLDTYLDGKKLTAPCVALSPARAFHLRAGNRRNRNIE